MVAALNAFSLLAATSSLRVPTYAPRFDVLRNLRPQSLSFANHASPMRSNIQQRLALHTSASSLANHFDTHQFVEELTREGLSRQQAEGVMAALAEVVDESIAGMSRTMVTKAEQEKASLRLLPSHRASSHNHLSGNSYTILRKSISRN